MATTRVVVSTLNGVEMVEYRTVGTGVVTSRGLEPAAGTDQANAVTLLTRARLAITQNATYLGLATPTAAQQTAQIDRLTRECSALLRVLLADTKSLADS